jgi:hypothetical protein
MGVSRPSPRSKRAEACCSCNVLDANEPARSEAPAGSSAGPSITYDLRAARGDLPCPGGSTSGQARNRRCQERSRPIAAQRRGAGHPGREGELSSPAPETMSTGAARASARPLAGCTRLLRPNSGMAVSGWKALERDTEGWMRSAAAGRSAVWEAIWTSCASRDRDWSSWQAES